MITSSPTDAPPPQTEALPPHHPIARLVAQGFGSGLWPFGPGTAGTLWAWAAFLVIDFFVPVQAWILILGLGWPLGVWACDRTGRALGRPDHGSMVWDEIWAFWLVLLFLPRPTDPLFPTTGLGLAPWQFQLLAFALFRLFDILKPPPIRWVDRRVKGGLGVMLDDLLAAGFTILLLAVLVRVLS